MKIDKDIKIMYECLKEFWEGLLALRYMASVILILIILDELMKM